MGLVVNQTGTEPAGDALLRCSCFEMDESADSLRVRLILIWNGSFVPAS